MADILLVEDTEDLAEQIADILKLEGHNVRIAPNGLVAMDLLLKENIKCDVILTDLVMPGLDGFGLIERVRRIDHLKNLPVIIMSAKSDQTTVERATSFGIRQFLSKPCPAEKLLESIEGVIGT